MVFVLYFYAQIDILSIVMKEICTKKCTFPLFLFHSIK